MPVTVIYVVRAVQALVSAGSVRVIVRDRVAALVGVAQEPAPEPAKEPAPEVVKVAVAQIAPAAAREAVIRAAMGTATEAATVQHSHKTLRQGANLPER